MLTAGGVSPSLLEGYALVFDNIELNSALVLQVTWDGVLLEIPRDNK